MGNSYSQLTLDERYQIKALSELNYAARKIAHKQERWHELLPLKGKRYRQRKGIEAGVHLIPNRVDIDERPAYVGLKV